MLVIISFFIFIAVALFIYFGIPFLTRTTMDFNKSRAKRFAREMDRTLLQDEIQKASTFYLLGPFILGLAGLILFPSEFRFAGALIGGIIGFMLPNMYVQSLVRKRKVIFGDQLIDALMIMSSSFRGGLSLIQSMEAVADEMPDPIRQEFSIVLGENKMGVSMDETLNRFYDRMPSPPLQQMVSAILLARETGGNLPVIFSRIVGTIRERKKIQQNLDVLTLQGRLQSVVMTLLPVAFFGMVTTSNPRYFDVMVNTDIGRTMGMIAIVLWVFGSFMVWKISSFKDF